MARYLLYIAGIILFYYLLHYYFYNYIEIDDISSLSRLPDMEEQLQEKLYGQHIATQNIPKFLKMHYKLPLKALVLCLVGSRGTGKTYFAKIFKEIMYKNNLENVYTFTPADCPLHAKNVITYQEELHKKINESISVNPRSLFIFENVEKMSSSIIESLEPFFELRYFGSDENLNKPIFLFMSNSGSKLIMKKLFNDFYKAGNSRTTANLIDFEEHLEYWISDQPGGFYRSKLTHRKRKLIDHYIPFLPLEKEHILLCIQDILAAKGIANPTEEFIKEILSYLEWEPHGEKVYSVSGCKDIKHKVILVLNKYEL